MTIRMIGNKNSNNESRNAYTIYFFFSKLGYYNITARHVFTINIGIFSSSNGSSSGSSNNSNNM